MHYLFYSHIPCIAATFSSSPNIFNNLQQFWWTTPVLPVLWSLNWNDPLFTSPLLPVTQMRTNASTARSAGERRATTRWEASAASAPPASTTSREAEDAQTSTSAPLARTPASLAAPTRTGATSVDAPLVTSEPDKGKRGNCCRKAARRYFQLTHGIVVLLGTVSPAWALVVGAPVLDKEARWMTILYLRRPAMNVRSTAITRRDANAAAPTQLRRIPWKTCR